MVIGTKIGRTKHMRIMPGGSLEAETSSSSKDGPISVFVGSKLDEHRGAFLLNYPMDKGQVGDGCWGDIDKIFEVSQIYFRIITSC